MPFDTSLFTPAQVTANITAPGVVDTTLGLPTTIIPTTDAWEINISWALSGSLLVPTVALVGGWSVLAFLEPLDDGANVPMLLSIPGVTTNPAVLPIPMAAGSSTVTISVPAGAVRPGLFTLTIAITWTIGIPLPMAAFNQGPIMQFFTP